jgi:1,4-dihydroxy-6-naphthoate synthase
MKLTIGFSPCPNDTFIFDAMVNARVDTKGLEFEYILEDVETLNRWAAESRLDITKLSYHAFLYTVKDYALLHSGSALGKGVGPLLVSKEPLDLASIQDFRIAIPGFHTTANLLLSLAFPQAKQKQEVIFNEIEQAVLSGAFDAGLIIHESRFTYEQKGLTKLMDLGDWWENTMKAPIPLGGIVIKRALGSELSKTVDEVIRASLQYSWNNYPTLSSFVTEHAQEMEESVMRQHIELYVNDYTNDLGVEGKEAVQTIFNKAKEQGLIKAANLPLSIFY